MQTIKRVLRISGAFVVVAAIALMSVSCSKNNPVDSSPAKGPAASLSGNYDSAYRWGGANGTWRGEAPFVIEADGDVIYNGTDIINPTIKDNRIDWTMADGNHQNGHIVVTEKSDSDYYWRDKGTVSQRNFTGWIQNAGEGKLDFRGLSK